VSDETEHPILDHARVGGDQATERRPKLKKKAYEKELARLHVELVKLQYFRAAQPTGLPD